MTKPKPIIIDLSEHQLSNKINYDLLAKNIDGAIVRIQYGSAYEDNQYKTHITELQKRGVPVAVYAWVRGTDVNDMRNEATTFYNRAKQFNPTFYWLDIEERSMSDMRSGVEAYRSTLQGYVGNKVGAYIANHLFSIFNIDVSKFNGIWIPTYGVNNGEYLGVNPTATNNYNLHQYTSNGVLPGFNGPLDVSRIANGDFSTFFGKAQVKPQAPKPQPQPAPTNVKWHVENATYVMNGDTNLRTQPTTNSGVIALLPRGSAIKYDAWAITNGYLWIRQPRSGGYGYVATGPANGNGRTEAAWGSFK